MIPIRPDRGTVLTWSSTRRLAMGVRVGGDSGGETGLSVGGGLQPFLRKPGAGGPGLGANVDYQGIFGYSHSGASGGCMTPQRAVARGLCWAMPPD